MAVLSEGVVIVPLACLLFFTDKQQTLDSGLGSGVARHVLKGVRRQGVDEYLPE